MVEAHHRAPDRYVLYINLDLKPQQRQTLLEAILFDAPTTNAPQAEIVDAGNLAALLNEHPHIRAAFFHESTFH